MDTDTKPGKDNYATLWQALCWLAYNDFDVHDPDGDGSLHQDIKLAYDTSGHKASLLEAVRDGKVSFEGRLGVHCDPPPSPGDAWREYHRTAHSAGHSPIEPKDWPSNYDDNVIGWTPSTLLTERGKFIDVRASRVIVCAWHPGPANQAVRQQIPLADQALEAAHQEFEEADQPQRVSGGRKPGSGAYTDQDRILWEKMKAALDQGDAKSIWEAAGQVAEDAPGTIVVENKRSRLAKGYRSWISTQ